MNKERFMKDFNGEKIFSLEYDKETLRDMVIEKQEEIERLNNIIKEVREYITSQKLHKIQDTTGGLTYQEIKLLEILDKGSNEPSFEEMVGFVEKVYKDIKSQSTLHEELEEERKTIAKIVGDFKEVNK